MSGWHVWGIKVELLDLYEIHTCSQEGPKHSLKSDLNAYGNHGLVWLANKTSGHTDAPPSPSTPDPSFGFRDGRSSGKRKEKMPRGPVQVSFCIEFPRRGRMSTMLLSQMLACHAARQQAGQRDGSDHITRPWHPEPRGTLTNQTRNCRAYSMPPALLGIQLSCEMRVCLKVGEISPKVPANFIVSPWEIGGYRHSREVLLQKEHDCDHPAETQKC